MFKTQRFCLENIYCAPGQDQQFNFSLVRVNNINQSLTNNVTVYNISKRLPNINFRYHVFVIGNLNPNFLNLLRQGRDWFKDVWVKVSEDMVLRNYIFKLYNEDGVIYSRDHIYYSFIDENSIIIALEFDHSLKLNYDVNSFKFLHLYSNSYFESNEFNNLNNKLGIKYDFSFVFNNADKVLLQNKILNYESNGGKALVYVNGYYTDNLNLNISDGSYIEIVYDQSIISKEKYTIGDLRTFDSIKDDKLKYLLFRNNIINRIQYQDDNEIYISNDGVLVTTGIYFYQHKEYAVRNVTDKDYSLYTSFINNSALVITNLTTGSIQDKIITLFTRKSGVSRELVYSSLKLHELYKLPQNVELDVLLNVNNSLHELRAEVLENSDYFKVASLGKIKDLNKELAASTLGYNGLTYYFANTPNVIAIGDLNIDVPILYQEESMAFEYDNTGKYIGSYTTSGPIYPISNINCKYVEFLYGRTPLDYGRLYDHNEVVTLLHNEYKVLSAYFNGVSRLTNWEDITNTNKCSVVDNILTLNESANYKVKIVYFNQPNIYDLQLELTDGVLYFPLTINEDRGTGIQLFPIDVPYSNIEIYLNGHKLTYGLDFFMSLPNVCITGKHYIDYSKQYQDIHIRMYGFTLDKDEINKQEVRGFINHGVLLRNSKYDIREDKVLSFYIDGKIYNKNNLLFAEEDSIVRIADSLNGLPYTVKEPFIAIKSVSGIDSYDMYNSNIEINNKISDLFNVIFPEPNIDQTNVISEHHYVYSPTISKIVYDMLDGNIPASLYQSPYNDSTILTLLDTEPYKTLLSLDPIKYNMPDSPLVEIHATIDNTVTNVNLFQYRFLTNVIRLITNSRPDRINISGYLSITV